MSEITLDTTNKAPLNWSATGTDRIVQNVYNIINTFKYEVAYNRDFGLSPDIIDSDIERAKSTIIEDLIDNIQKNEPRATIKELEIIDVSATGDISAIITIEI